MILGLCACSDDDDGDDSNTPNQSQSQAQPGVFLDSPVANFNYELNGSGVIESTNDNGEFDFDMGDDIMFSIGSLSFPQVTAKEVITPLDLAGTFSITDQKATNMARFLQSLDEDGNLSNGITIPEAASANAVQVDFDVDATTFENNPDVIYLLENSGSVNTKLITAEDAQAHLAQSIGGQTQSSTVQAWRYIEGELFYYLFLFADNTFLFAEREEKSFGLETGVYSHNTGNGDLIFNILYDDNAPGMDYGAGDIGVTGATDAFVTNGGTQIEIDNSEFIGYRADFNGVPVQGVWRYTNGEEFNYLALFDDGTFLYAENDLSTQNTLENGIEKGTYTYDSNIGMLTFNITFDDNDPGNDSGIGDIGGPIEVQAALSNNNNELTNFANAISLTRAF